MTRTLDELEAGRLLEAYGIPMAPGVLCGAQEQLPEIAAELGFPLVMKILSPDIPHKTEADCVRLPIGSVEEMRKAYHEILENANRYAPNARIKGVLVQKMQKQGLEAIFGVNRDAQFGPIILFGMGGIYVELLEAVSMRLLPITRKEAIEMIDETPLKKVFTGARGKQYDREEVITVLLGLSRLLTDHPNIREIDINPFKLFETGGGSCGVDALIVMETE